MRLAKIMSFEQFAAEAGASRQSIGDAGLHNPAGHIPRRSWQAMRAAQNARDEWLLENRQELRAEFRALVEAGHIIEPTSEQRMRNAAEGEGERAEAAKRVLARMAARREREGERNG